MSNRSWSFSQYSDALKCLQYDKYLNVDKLGEPAKSGDTAFGTAIHSAIASFLEGENSREVFSILWDLEESKDLQYTRFRWGELKGIGDELLRKYEKGHGKKMELVFGEKRLYGEYKGVKLEGTLDFLGDYNGKMELVDFKTSAYSYDRDKVTCSLQLSLYAYLAEQNGLPRPERLSYLTFVKSTKSIQYTTRAHDGPLMYSQLDSMVNYVKLIEARDMTQEYKNPNGCFIGTQRCQFFDKCWKGI